LKRNGASLMNNNPFKRGRIEVLPDAGNQPDPTQQKIDYYQQNHEKIVDPIVLASLRKHREDVLHGSRSLNMLIPNFYRKPGDWDIYSPNEKKRALAFEEAIDKKVGADITETIHIEVPKSIFGFNAADEDDSSKDLYRVVAPRVSNDGEIDVMSKPKNLKTTRHKGITHESLESQYARTVTRRHRQPMKASQARSDQTEIEDYWYVRGRTPPTVPSMRMQFTTTQPTSIRMSRKRVSRPLLFRV